MSENEKDGANLREELGLTVDRGNELMRITQSIMDQSSGNDGYGRTSHVLLSIAGRKDLNDVEKVACAFLFSCKTVNTPTKIMGNPSVHNMKDTSLMDMPRIMDIDMSELQGHTSGMVVAPQGVDLSELIAVVMATLMSLLKQMPKHEAQDFCRSASLSFAKMAFTGDVKL